MSGQKKPSMLAKLAGHVGKHLARSFVSELRLSAIEDRLAALDGRDGADQSIDAAVKAFNKAQVLKGIEPNGPEASAIWRFRGGDR